MTAEQLRELLASTDLPTVITGLKAKVVADDYKTRTTGLTNELDDYKKQFDVNQHKVTTTAHRPDKVIKTGATEEDVKNGKAKEKPVKVARISLALQEIILERAVAFLFGTPVKIVCTPDGDNQKTVLKALKRILKDNKIDPFNQEVALEMFRTTEVAEGWFPVTKSEEHNDYGFPTKFKLRSMIFSPWDGNELYPLFDDTGDMIAFSRGYVVIDNGREISRFETYTVDNKIVWEQRNGTWEEIEKKPNPIGKIPIVYGRQKAVEWASVQNLIERLEDRLSNFADTNDYHGSPTIFVKGVVTAMPDKGEAGKIIQSKGADAEAKYLEWDQAPDMTKLEIETLNKFIFSLTQTPDISFESVKGLGDISGIALKLLFMDAHLKVKKKQRVFDAYLERRTNIIKAYIGNFKKELEKDVKSIEIDTQIQPFMIDDLQAMIETLMTANGNQPLLSRETSVAMSGLTDNPDQEYQRITEEVAAARNTDIFND